MSNAGLMLSVDIGNTRVHIGVVDVAKRVCRAVDAFPTGELEKRFSQSVAALANSCSVPLLGVAAVSGVVKNAVAQAVIMLEQMGLKSKMLQPGAISAWPPLSAKSKTTQLQFCYSQPETLGADRIANALYAHAMYPESRCIIISAGTAVVIDYLDSQSFRGGAILPGAAMQLKALHSFTDALPELPEALEGSKCPVLPAVSTQSCMAGGVLCGLAGAVNSIVGKYMRLEEGPSPVVLATGGGWGALSAMADFNCTVVADMTLVGIALFAAV